MSWWAEETVNLEHLMKKWKFGVLDVFWGCLKVTLRIIEAFIIHFSTQNCLTSPHDDEEEEEKV